MTKFIGRLADVGFTKEGTRGTAETAAAFWASKMTLSLDDGIEQVVDESSKGVIEDAFGAAIVSLFATAQIEGNIYDKSFGLLLLAAFGAVSTGTVAETSVYTHTYAVGQNAQHPSLSLFLNEANQDYIYPLAMLESLAIDIALKQFSKYTASFRSKAGATATLSPSYTVENMFLPQTASIKTASDLSGLTAASEISVRSVKINISKNAEDDRRLGSTDPADIINKQFAVDGTLELVYNDQTFKTEMLADTAKAMRLRLTNDDVTIGTDMHPQLTIDLAHVKFSKFAKNYSNNDLVVATVDFKAFYSLADTAMATAELINEQVSY